MRPPTGHTARRLSGGAAVVAASLLLSSLATTAAAADSGPPIPAAPQATGSTAEQFGGSAQGLGTNVAGQVTGTGFGPSVYSGTGEGPDRYVALGDSYAAVGRIAPGAWTTGPVACVRTDDAYPAVVARELGVGTFLDASCGGAVSDDLWRPDEGVPPQFDALNAETDLVSLTIGGNDVGFSAVILACAVRTNVADPFLPAVDPVLESLSKDFDASTGCSDVIDRQASAALDGLGSRLDAVYGEITRRSPEARVVTVGYLAALPDEEAIRHSPDCAPLMAATKDQRAKMRGFQDRLNQVVREAAERTGATAVIPDEPGHSMCTPADTRWVDLTGLGTGAAPVHPTTAGHAHVADRVLDALNDGP